MYQFLFLSQLQNCFVARNKEAVPVKELRKQGVSCVGVSGGVKVKKKRRAKAMFSVLLCVFLCDLRVLFFLPRRHRAPSALIIHVFSGKTQDGREKISLRFCFQKFEIFDECEACLNCHD